MSGSYKEVYGSSAGPEDTTKKGLCFMELKRSGMVQWGELGQTPSAGQHQDPRVPSISVKEEQHDQDVMAASHLSPQTRKRRPKLSQPKESKSVRRLKQKQPVIHKQIKCEKSVVGQGESSISIKNGFIARWSTERYKLAEKSMLEVMKAEGAILEKPVSRSVLRHVARPYISDTGLLDHLLKHIDGKVAPGGKERFRRCYNTEGRMEYWLESADTVRIKPENGVPNSNWVPPSCWIPGSTSTQQSVSTGEMALLKEEMAKLKRDMEELATKNKEQNQANTLQGMLKELMTWRTGADQRLIAISSSLTGVQNMYQDLITWKSEADKKLIEISNSMNGTAAPKQCSTSLSPVSERWEDWLENNSLGEDLVPWIGSSDLPSVGQDSSQPWPRPESLYQEPSCGRRDFELLKKELAQVNSYLLPERREDGQASVSPDSSVTKFDSENPFLLFQEMMSELMKWRAKMEERMLEIWNAVGNLQAAQKYKV